jgi:hypothetical protein
MYMPMPVVDSPHDRRVLTALSADTAMDDCTRYSVLNSVATGRTSNAVDVATARSSVLRT